MVRRGGWRRLAGGDSVQSVGLIVKGRQNQKEGNGLSFKIGEMYTFIFFCE